jgi:hypothetical protein
VNNSVDETVPAVVRGIVDMRIVPPESKPAISATVAGPETGIDTLRVRSVVLEDSEPAPHALATRAATTTALRIFNFFMFLTL